LLALLRVAFLVALRAPPLRADAFRATVLRVLFFAPRFAPVREPAERLELLREDFLVAMLYSGTLFKPAHVNPSKNRAQMYNAQEFFARIALYLSVQRIPIHADRSQLMPSNHDGARGMLHTILRFTRQSTLSSLTIAAAFAVAACSKGEGTSAATSTPVAGKLSVAAAPAGADSNHADRVGSLPVGYKAVFDDADAKVSEAVYSEKEPGRFEVKTGPAHILFSPADTAANKYTVSATFEQLGAPAHPEAFGVFIGGSKLDSPSIKYTYFVVRGDGQYMIKVRDGAKTRTLTDWTAQPSIPKQDAAGKGLYGLRIEVSGKSANVSVNGAPITTIAGKDAPLNGITGVRINHNLHLIVTPVSVIR
jgi:hypothetical protein